MRSPLLRSDGSVQRAIEIYSLESYAPCELEVTEPGILRRIVTGAKPSSAIIKSSTGAPPTAEMTPIPALMFEVDPSLQKRTRRFLWLSVDVKIDYPGTLQFCDTYVDETTGAPLILYEVSDSLK